MDNRQEVLKDRRCAEMNRWSCYSSIICLLLYVVFRKADYAILGWQPIVLCITVITFFVGLIGLSGVKDWKGMLRSITTILLTAGLSLFLAIHLVIGYFLA